jgi:hypothetical protein
MHQIRDILEKIYNNEELRSTVVPLFMSTPGQGKSMIIEEFMKDKGVWKPPFVLSQRLPYEISGMALVDKELDKMKYYDFDFILDLKDGDVLFIDEVTNSHPVTLNAFLTFLESRVTISGKSLPKIMIVGAGNYEGMLPMTPQIKQRFLWYDIKFDKESWKRYMAKYFITDNMFEQLCVLVQNESFNSSDKNYFTPRSIEKAIKMILAGVNTPYERKLTPILNTMITNNSGKDITLGETTWKANEMISWLKLQKLNNENYSKQ